MAQVKKRADSEITFEWNITYGINHTLRREYGLSNDEYVYLDMIAKLAAQQGGYTRVSHKSAGKALGCAERTIGAYYSKLISLKLIEEQDYYTGDAAPKRASALWWEKHNFYKEINTPTQNLHTPTQNLHTPTQNLHTPTQNLHTIEHTIDNNINNNTFSKEKDISEKTEVFSPQTENKKIVANSNLDAGLFSKKENQTEKEKNCGKKEKAETPETEGEDYLTAGQLPTYNQLQIKPELWAAFVGAVVKRLPSQKPKNKIKRSIFVAWATKLKAIENKFADSVIVGHFQDYENKTWQSPFFTGYAETLQKAQKDYNFTNQNNNNQNGTNQSTTKPNAKPDANTVARILDRDRELNEFGY